MIPEKLKPFLFWQLQPIPVITGDLLSKLTFGAVMVVCWLTMPGKLLLDNKCH